MGIRRRLLGAIPTLLLGAGLLLGAQAADAQTAVHNLWGDTCHLDWCRDRATDPVDEALTAAARLAELEAGDDCHDASRFKYERPGRLPATMVIRRPGGELARVPWTMPAPAGAATLRLCAGVAS